MEPIFNSGSGSISLLAFAIGMAAYVRGVYSNTLQTYDRVLTEQETVLWPLDQEFTLDRLTNLRGVLDKLVWVTNAMFLFMFFALARLLISVINAASFACINIPNTWLHGYDIFLGTYATVTLVGGFIFHRITSVRERALHDKATVKFRIRLKQAQLLTAAQS